MGDSSRRPRAKSQEFAVEEGGDGAGLGGLVAAIDVDLVVGDRPALPVDQGPEVVEVALAVDAEEGRVGVVGGEDRVAGVDVGDGQFGLAGVLWSWASPPASRAVTWRRTTLIASAGCPGAGRGRGPACPRWRSPRCRPRGRADRPGATSTRSPPARSRQPLTRTGRGGRLAGPLERAGAARPRRPRGADPPRSSRCSRPATGRPSPARWRRRRPPRRARGRASGSGRTRSTPSSRRPPGCTVIQADHGSSAGGRRPGRGGTGAWGGSRPARRGSPSSTSPGPGRRAGSSRRRRRSPGSWSPARDGSGPRGTPRRSGSRSARRRPAAGARASARARGVGRRGRGGGRSGSTGIGIGVSSPAPVGPSARRSGASRAASRRAVDSGISSIASAGSTRPASASGRSRSRGRRRGRRRPSRGRSRFAPAVRDARPGRRRPAPGSGLAAGAGRGSAVARMIGAGSGPDGPCRAPARGGTWRVRASWKARAGGEAAEARRARAGCAPPRGALRRRPSPTRGTRTGRRPRPRTSGSRGRRRRPSGGWR